jgi:hypothetical protein
LKVFWKGVREDSTKREGRVMMWGESRKSVKERVGECGGRNLLSSPVQVSRGAANGRQEGEKGLFIYEKKKGTKK